jgi:uncharacterized membrane protein YjfL (UPF0719 family)
MVAQTIDIVQTVTQMVLAIAWVLVGGIALALCIPATFKIFDAATPGLEELKELQKGNIAVAIVLASVVLTLGMVAHAVLTP